MATGDRQRRRKDVPTVKQRAAADIKEPFVRNTGKQMVKREEI